MSAFLTEKEKEQGSIAQYVGLNKDIQAMAERGEIADLMIIRDSITNILDEHHKRIHNAQNNIVP